MGRALLHMQIFSFSRSCSCSRSLALVLNNSNRNQKSNRIELNSENEVNPPAQGYTSFEIHEHVAVYTIHTHSEYFKNSWQPLELWVCRDV